MKAARTVKIESLHGLFRSVLYVTSFGITIMTKTMTNKNHNDIMTELFIEICRNILLSGYPLYVHFFLS